MKKRLIRLFGIFTILSSIFFAGCSEDSESESYSAENYGISENNEITITFNANDGSTTPATTTQTVKSGTAVTLNENTFQRDGYTFQGWAIDSSSSYVVYKDKDSYTAYANRTLYAIWKSDSQTSTEAAKSFTVTLDSNDGSGKTKKITKTSGEKILFSFYKNEFTRKYATLIGYNTKADGKGTNYSLNIGTLEVKENTTLYAQWKENPKITFDANGGKASDGSTEYYQYLNGLYYSYGGGWKFAPTDTKTETTDTWVGHTDYYGASLTKNKFVRDGYTFLGWATSQNSNTADYDDGDYLKKAFSRIETTLTDSGELYSGKALYAIWKEAED